MAEARVFSDLACETLLDDDRVLVQRHVASPGQTLGAHSHVVPQLVVYVRGGHLQDATGRTTIWRNGRVRWVDGTDSVDDGGINAGDDEIEIITISLKPVPADAAPPARPVKPLSYPNVPGEDLLENDFVVVQRFVINPGQWEGVHAHQPNMLFVYLTDGHWAERTYSNPIPSHAEPSAAGSVGWMDPVELDVGHESGNVGTTPNDFLWVSLKQ